MAHNRNMNDKKSKNFRRLARLRGNRAVNDIRLIGNLANKNNYVYSDSEVNSLFSAIEQELRIAKTNFQRYKKREVNL